MLDSRARWQRLLTPSEVQVRLFGDITVVTGQAEASVLAGERAARFALRFTHGWMRRDGRW